MLKGLGMFTRKHYRAIAKILKNHDDFIERVNKYTSLCNDLADYFASDNPRFDREKFLAACGVK